MQTLSLPRQITRGAPWRRVFAARSMAKRCADATPLSASPHTPDGRFRHHSETVIARFVPPHARPVAVSRGHGAKGGCFHHATASRPFFATKVKSFSEAPRGRFSLRSHWLTRPAVTLMYRAKTA